MTGLPRPESFVTMPDRPWVAPGVEVPGDEPRIMPVNLLDAVYEQMTDAIGRQWSAPEPLPGVKAASLEKNTIAFTISREMALDYGLVEPTPEEAEQRAAHLEQHQREHAEEQHAAALVVRALDAIADPTWRAVLDLHQRDVYLDRDYRCDGCDADGYEVESPAYPCRTTRLVASLYGLPFPDGLRELDRPTDGSLDPKETT